MSCGVLLHNVARPGAVITQQMETFTFMFPAVPALEVSLPSSTKVPSTQVSEAKRLLLTRHWPPTHPIRPEQVSTLRFLSMGRELADGDPLQVVKRIDGDSKRSPVQVHIVRGPEPRVKTEGRGDEPTTGNCCCACILF